MPDAGIDNLHHAPACPANHYHGSRKVTGRCTCGATTYMYYGDPTWSLQNFENAKKTYAKNFQMPDAGKFSIKPIFAWYDLWVGAFYDKAKRRLYVFPLPMFGLLIQLPQEEVNQDA